MSNSTNTSDGKPLTSANVVPWLRDIFSQHGDQEYLGEPVTISQHMLQSAMLAERASDPEPIIVAALLHDIGHFTSNIGSVETHNHQDRLHEHAGADVLAGLFPDLILDCIRYHVDAKRYLCATDSSYFDLLSDASVHSLNLQGGPMSDDEVASFEQNPNLDAIVKIRRYDDAGKTVGEDTRSFDFYAPMIQRVVDTNS